MMKNYFTLLFLLITFTCFGQSKRSLTNETTYDNVFHYDISQHSSIRTVSLIVDEATEYISAHNYTLKSGADNFVLLNGSKQIKLSVTIPRDSIKYYRYNLIENDTLIVKDNATLNQIDLVYPKRSNLPGKAIVNLGNINIYNKKLRLELYKLPNKFKITSIIIFNKPLKPFSFKINLGTVKEVLPWPVSQKEQQRLFKKYNGKFYEELEIKHGDTIYNTTKTTTMSILPNNKELSFLYKIDLKGYNRLGIFTTLYNSNDWNDGSYTMIHNGFFKSPGNYRLEFSLRNFFDTKGGTYPELESREFEFTVAKENDVFTAKQVIIFLIIVAAILGVIATVIIIFIKRKNKRKVLAEQRQKEIAKIKLESVRSQLNPHFMFNALAGIQSLMNKQQTEEANEYLSKFSRITRKVLENEEMNSLAQEKALLDDYLEMEQFRFGFSYQLFIDENLDIENTEIPAMLLQPLVENAVKHGVAEQGNKGRIEIFFEQDQNNLILKIVDYGSGFDTSKSYMGLGLRLSKDRIALLNNIYKETPTTMQLIANDKGATILITLKNWL